MFEMNLFQMTFKEESVFCFCEVLCNNIYQLIIQTIIETLVAEIYEKKIYIHIHNKSYMYRYHQVMMIYRHYIS